METMRLAGEVLMGAEEIIFCSMVETKNCHEKSAEGIGLKRISYTFDQEIHSRVFSLFLCTFEYHFFPAFFANY